MNHELPLADLRRGCRSSTDVMRRLGPLGFIHLEDQVERILERRTQDSNKRPARTLDQLHLYQERSRAVCKAFRAALGKPVFEVRSRILLPLSGHKVVTFLRVGGKV